MRRRLPPLNSLRAFEAAAHHLSFTKAAAELNVTPAAISHQVKALEELAGTPLFVRLTRALALTDRGRSALPALTEAFDRLAEGAGLLTGGPETDVFTITTAPSFAAKWLVPRLDDFQELNPGLKVRIDAAMDVVDLRREGIDVAIRYGRGDYPGYHADRLFEQEVFPVCSPKLMTGAHPLNGPADLAHHTLLHSGYTTARNPSYSDWRMWLKLAGATDVDWRKGPEFSPETMAVQAALEGHGVALINTSLVSDDLASGKLVRPFKLGIPTGFAYYLVIPDETVTRPVVSAFRTWILDQACS
ncbi:MAG: transcriptional regulator GcvA [Rhodospirillaceae bacterium]|nr:transcriptional regulator GcvA [Rhodospirillaceae bacterium]